MSIDATIKKYGIKFMFVESGPSSIRTKCEEIGYLSHEINSNWNYWVELSWGIGEDGEGFDFAYCEFGKTFGEAFGACISAFKDAVASGQTEQCRAALKFNL